MASWPGMPEYVFEDIRSSMEVPAARSVRQENEPSPRPMIIQRTPKTPPYGQFSLLEHTVLATMVLIGREQSVVQIITPHPPGAVASCSQQLSANSNAATRLSPPLEPTTLSKLSFILIQTYLYFRSILNKSTDMAYNTIHI